MTRKEECDTIAKICDRAEAMGIVASSANPKNKRLTLIMDIDNAHKAIGLQLDKLLEADDLNFAHDVIGIQKHMNRTTGELADFFVPRYAKQDVASLVEDAMNRSQEQGSQESVKSLADKEL